MIRTSCKIFERLLPKKLTICRWWNGWSYNAIRNTDLKNNHGISGWLMNVRPDVLLSRLGTGHGWITNRYPINLVPLGCVSIRLTHPYRVWEERVRFSREHLNFRYVTLNGEAVSAANNLVAYVSFKLILSDN